MRRSLPLAVQTDDGDIEHYWLDEVATLDPAELQQALHDSGHDPDVLELDGLPLAAHTAESLSGFATGLFLEPPSPNHGWQRDLVLDVLAGPNTGYSVRLPDLGDLAESLRDDHIGDGVTLLHRNGKVLLVTGQQRTAVELEEAFTLGNSVIRIRVEAPAPVPQTSESALRLPPDRSVPNRHYRYFLALAIGPLLIGVVLIVFTKMWFFLLFGVLSLFGGLLPYLQGRRAWIEYRTELQQRWQQACLLHQGVFVGSGSHTGTQRRGKNIHLTLGYGTQHPPLELPRLPKSLRPALRPLQPVGVTLRPGPSREQRTAETPQSPHGLRVGHTLHIEATAAHHQGILRQLLVQVLPQLAGQNCWVRDSGRHFADPDLLKWCRFFPHLHFLGPESDAVNFAPGDVLISCGQEEPAAGAQSEIIQVVISDAPNASTDPSWYLDAHRLTLSFLGPTGEDDRHHPDAAQLSHLRTTQRDQFVRRLQELIRLPGTTEADRLALETLPARNGTTATRLTACLGSEGHGPVQDQFHLDLVTDGPHMLVVGTTGSGKSVLLRRVTAEWVARYGSDELNLVLVDFKGGATFTPFIGLPHTVAHLTDLDGENTPRLLTAIRAELKRREQLFASRGCQDFTHYRNETRESLPRIAVLVDEFAVFAGEQPAALDELIHLATIGRSLGFHLVLATQRTGGHLSLGLRSNLSVKVCLRVLNDNESHELIGTTAAAQLRPDQPGYAYIHTSGLPARPFRVIPHRGKNRPRLRPADTPRSPTPDSDGAELAQLLGQLPKPRRNTTVPAPASVPVPSPFLLPSLAPAPTHPSPRVLARVDLPSQGTQPWCLLGNAEQPDVSADSLAIIGQLCDFATDRITQDPALACNTILLAASPKERLRFGLAGYTTVDDALTGVQMLSSLRHELDRQETTERFLIIEDLTRWLSVCEQHRLYEVELIVADLVRMSRQPRNNLKILLHVDAAHSHHQLVNACQHRFYLPRGIAEQQRLLWPSNVRYTEVLGRGLLTGVGLPEEGALAQLLPPPLQEETLVARPEHRWSPLPEHVPAEPQLYRQGKLFLGRHDLDHRPLYRHRTGLLAVIGPPDSGKTQLCRLLSEQAPEAIIVDDAHALPGPELTDLQSALATDPDRLLVVATTPEQLRRPQLSFLTGHLHHGSHILLRPHLPGHFDPFLLTPVPLGALPPGRAILIEDGTTTVFQAAQLTESIRPTHTPQWPTRRSLRARERSG